jgi:hypothetical protein
MFEVENQFYQANRETLRGKYLGKAIVIIGETVTGVYDNIGEAYIETLKTQKQGTFCLKNIPVDPEEAYIEDHPRLTHIIWPAHA